MTNLYAYFIIIAILSEVVILTTCDYREQKAYDKGRMKGQTEIIEHFGIKPLNRAGEN